MISRYVGAGLGGGAGRKSFPFFRPRPCSASRRPAHLFDFIESQKIADFRVSKKIKCLDGNFFPLGLLGAPAPAKKASSRIGRRRLFVNLLLPTILRDRGQAAPFATTREKCVSQKQSPL
jgi:hypothetical protein